MIRLCILALTVTFATWAQGRISGTVTGIDPAKRQCSLQTDAGVIYAVSILENAKLRKIEPGQADLTKAETIGIEAIANGDRVLARGKQDDSLKTLLAADIIVVSKQDLQSREQARQKEWRTNSVNGVVKSVDPLTLAARGNTTWAVDVSKLKSVHRYADDSSNFATAKPAQVADLQPGDQIKVLGAKADGKVEASEIVFGRFKTMGGEIKAIDAASNKITLYDLTQKKNVVVQMSKDVTIKRAPTMPAGMGGGRGGFRGGPGAGGPGAGGGPGGPGAAQRPGGPDPAMMLDRLPPATFADLKTGDAVILTAGTSNGTPVALTLVAGLDFLLRAPAQQANQMISNWNIDGGGLQ